MTLVHVEVTPRSNGHLMCESCGTYWCLHVEQVVKNGADAEWIWTGYPLPVQLEIPIVPTANLWATVMLEKPETAKAPMFRIEYMRTNLVDGIYIGVLLPSEGRSVMRAMLLDWFMGTQEATVGKCESAGHGYKQEVRYLEDIQSPGGKIVQQWSIWNTRKCLGCTFDMADNKDLVPSAEPTSSPWS